MHDCCNPEWHESAVRSVATVPNPTIHADSDTRTTVQVRTNDGGARLDLLLEERRPSTPVRATMVQAQLNDDDLDWLIESLRAIRQGEAVEAFSQGGPAHHVTTTDRAVVGEAFRRITGNTGEGDDR